MSDDEVLQRYRDHLKARKYSFCYFNYISVFLKYCQEHNIDYLNINASMLTDFFNNNKYSANSVNLFVKSARHFSKFMGNEKNGWFDFKYVRVPKRKPEYISEETLEELCKHLSKKLALVISFMTSTGIRRGELLALKKRNVDLFQNPCSVLVMGKGGRERYIYFSEKYSPKLKEKMLEYFKSEKENVDSNIFNITLSKLNYACVKLNKYSNGIHIHPHIFRHIYAKTMVSKGLPITYLSSMLGHSNVSITTQIYACATEELIRAYF